MAFLKTERTVLDGSVRREVDMKYDVSVDRDGCFSTTLPREWADKILSRNITLDKNRLGNPGYITGHTLEELNKKVLTVMKKYVSRELILEEVVLRYVIGATCFYCLDKKGNIVPNGGYEGAGSWRMGMEKSSVLKKDPYGISVYVQPYAKQTYRFVSGDEVVEYKHLCHANKKIEMGENLKWLDGLTSMAKPESQPLMELPYDEKIGLFFVNLVKSICQVNEHIKGLTDPESIKVLAAKGMNLLNQNNPR